MSPALYPRRRLGWRALTAVATGRVQLPIEPADFTRDPAAQQTVAADPDRIKAVSPSFLFATWQWMRFARRAPPLALPTLVALTPDDTLIDVEKTRRLARSKGFTMVEFAGKAHSLVLEAPQDLALALERHATNAGIDEGRR